MSAVSWLTYFIGFGLSWANLNDSYDNPSRSYALDLGAARYVSPGVALGVHVRGSHVRGRTGDRGGPRSADTLHEFYTVDIAATALFTRGRIGFAPWLGLHAATGTAETFYGGFEPDPTPPSHTRDVGPVSGIALGALLSLDVVKAGPHRVGVYSEGQAVLVGIDDSFDSFALTLGLVYRRL